MKVFWSYSSYKATRKPPATAVDSYMPTRQNYSSYKKMRLIKKAFNNLVLTLLFRIYQQNRNNTPLKANRSNRNKEVMPTKQQEQVDQANTWAQGKSQCRQKRQIQKQQEPREAGREGGKRPTKQKAAMTSEQTRFGFIEIIKQLWSRFGPS